MKDQVYRAEYYITMADDKLGKGADPGKRLAQENVNLLSMHAFPTGDGKIQVDLVPEQPEQLTKAARKIGLTLNGPKIAFLIQGTDRAGALGEILGRLGSAGINVTATTGVACGGNRYGALLWVKPAEVEAASRVLGAVTMSAHHV